MILIILVILVAAILLNSYMMKKEAMRKEYEHERRQERFERLMGFLQKSNSDKKDERSVARNDDKTFKT